MKKYMQSRTLFASTLLVGVFLATTLIGSSTDFETVEDSDRKSFKPGSDEPRRDDDHLAVLTFNLKTPSLGSPDLLARTEAVRDFIESRKPDAIALQEVTVSPGSHRNVAKTLAEQTGYRYRWQKTHDLLQLYREGIAILSRWPISWSGSTKLPHSEGAGAIERAILGARIEHPRAPFEFFSTHTTVKDTSDEQVDQIEAIRAFVDRHRETPSAWLGGDLNAEPGSPMLERLRSYAARPENPDRWIDAWEEQPGSGPGGTVPSWKPERRIDYIFTIRRPANGDPSHCDRVLDRPVRNGNNHVYPSDHVGVYCTFPLVNGGASSDL